jgi:hypothetical protein
MTALRRGLSKSRARSWLALALGVAVPSLEACEVQKCNDGGQDPAGAYVIDAVTLQPICDSSVFLRRDSGWVSLSQTGCSGIFVFEYGPGSFEIRVEAPNHAQEQLVVEVTQDECDTLHVRGDGPKDGKPGYANLVTVALEPS